MKKRSTEKYINALRELGGRATARQVSELLGVRQNSAWVKLNDLMEEGFVAFGGFGKPEGHAKAPTLYRVVD